MRPRLPFPPAVTSALAALALLALILVRAPAAHAMPTIKDAWHFSCAPRRPVAKLLNKARAKAEAAGLNGAIGSLRYACLLEVHEIEQLEARLAKFQEQGGAGARPTLDNRSSATQLKRATSLLQSAYNAKKSDPKALYYYSYALALLGDDLAVNRFDDLMKDYPDLPVTKDAYLVLGDFYFEKRDIQKAFREYNLALKKGRPVVQAYVRYKTGWINFALAIDAKDVNKQRKAVSDMAALAERTKDSKEPAIQRLSELIETDVIELLAQQGDLNVAQQILKRIGAEGVYAGLLERMAYVKVGAGDARGALDLFTMSLKEDATRPSAPQISATIVQLAAQLNDVKRLVEALKAMANDYASKRSDWLGDQKKNKEAAKKARAQTEQLIYEYAVDLDRQGRAANNQLYLWGAAQLYTLYGKTFPTTARAFEVRTLYGALLFAQGQHLQSASYMLALIKEQREPPPKGKSKKPRPARGKVTKDMAAVMVTAAQVAVDNDKTEYKLPEPGTALAPLDLPPVKKIYIECLDLYVKLLPLDPNAAPMSFTAASVLYDFGDYEQAIPRYQEFIKRFPSTEFTKTAAVRLLIYHEKQKVGDDDDLKASLARIEGVPSLKADPDLGPVLVSLKQRGEEAPKAKKEKGKKEKTKKKGKKKKKPVEEPSQNEDADAAGGGGGEDDDFGFDE